MGKCVFKTRHNVFSRRKKKKKKKSLSESLSIEKL